jgi:hypothetical protein
MPSKYRILFPLTYMLGIFTLSSIPDTGRIESQLDKVFHWVSPELQNLLHIPLYGGLAGSWYWAMEYKIIDSFKKSCYAFVFTMTYSLIDEYYQLSIPGRFGSFTDLALNAIGAIIMLAIIALHERRHEKH